MIKFISGYVLENELKPPMTAKLEERLLRRTKVEKVDTKPNGYEEALRGNQISFNQGLDASVMKCNKPNNRRAHLGINKNKLKEKKRVEEKVCEKMDQKYEPLYRRKKMEEGCVAWMSRVNRVPEMAKVQTKDSNFKEAPS